MSTLTVDPALFRADAISPSTARINTEIEAALAKLPTIIDLGATETRARRRAGHGLLGQQPAHPRARWAIADALGRQVPVRIIEPATHPRGVLLHIHGGGHCLGSADGQDQTLAGIADRLSVAVVSAEYRLAPEHPYPASPDDCETVGVWLANASSDVFGTNRLLIMGESAGAHLCAATLIRMRHKYSLMPFLAASLVYGQFSMNLLPAARNWGTRNLVLNTPIIDWFNEGFLPNTAFKPEARADPDISPINANLSDLCPALFTCGTLDPLIDDSILMAKRWEAAGNTSVLSLYPGGIHVFNMIPSCDIGNDANTEIEKWFSATLSAN